MKLLFDQNLPRRLPEVVSGLFPESTHVAREELMTASDEAIWVFAKNRDFIIVSKDTDFYQRSMLYGQPPKVVWMNVGNCTTGFVEDLLRRRSNDIIDFAKDDTSAFFILA